MKNFILFALVISLPLFGSAQFVEDFTDGDFTANPTWAGDVTQYIVNASNELQLNNVDVGGAGQSGTTYLSTAVQTSGLANWEFYVFQDFSPSTSNYSKVYLSADNSDLNGSLNGYYLRIGGASAAVDAIELYRQDGTASTMIFTGTIGAVSAASMVRVRVERDNAGNWTLKTDYTGGTNLTIDGTGTDNTYTTGDYIGVWCRQTATRFDKFYFDDFSVDPVFVDMTPPSLVSATPNSPTEVELLFSEPVDQTTAETASNYVVDNGIGSPSSALRSSTNPALVTLTLGTPMTSGTTYSLSIINVEDVNSNGIPAAMPEMESWLFIQTLPATPGDLIFNEIFADETPVVGLPASEYVELYNRSANFIDLDGFSFSDASTSKILGPAILAPGEYLILCDNNDIASYTPFGDVLGMSSMPSLNNGGDSISLVDPGGIVIDVVVYDVSMYQDAVKAMGGWSLELINPALLCTGNANWIASDDASGGTPGTVNSVFDNTPDTTGPAVASVNPDNATQITLTFDEALLASTATIPANYSVDNGINISTVVLVNPTTVQLNLSNSLINNTTYTVTANSGLTDCSGNAAGMPNTGMFTFIIFDIPIPQDIIINEILADPSPPVGLPEMEYVELYNRTLNKTFNLVDMDFEGVTLPPFTLGPGEYVVLHDDVLAFGPSIPAISFPSFPTITNGGEDLILSDDSGLVIDEVVFSIDWYQDPAKDDGGWSLELVNPNLLCTAGANWLDSNDPLGGTPGAQNSVFDDTPDTTGPFMVDALPSGNMEIIVSFNEILDVASANVASNYTVDNGIVVSSVTLLDSITVQLSLGAALADMTTYTVTVNSAITDCSGNALGTPNSDMFTYYLFGTPMPGDIIITEIMADINPTVGQPALEYVELHNTSSTTFNLEGMDFEGAIIPEYFPLVSGAYVVLHKVDTAAMFPTGIPAIAIPSLPTFTDGGEDLILTDISGVIIDELIYDKSWYRDTDKDDGGYSLELINPNLLCKGEFNWIATNHPTGGTPGAQNSVYENTLDNVGPNLLSATYISSTEVLLQFDDVLDTLLAADIANYSGLPNLTNANLIGPADTAVVLVNAFPFVDQTTYTITVSGLTDCIGNAITINTASFNYILTVPAARYDILINEFMADVSPSPLGLPDMEFVELYNRTTDKAFDLAGMEFEGKVLPRYILEPGQYIILHDDELPYQVGFPTLPVPSLPTITDAGEDLELLDANGLVIDALVFNTTWYGDSDRDGGGWSLERVNPNRACELGTNWRVTQDELGGTPGRQNSVYENTADDDRPDLLKVYPINDVTLELTFSEALDQATATDPSNYTVDNGIGSPITAVLNPNLFNTVVITLANPLQTGTNYEVEVSSISDCELNDIGMFNTKAVAIPELMEALDLIINEVLYNPITGGKDFVELYNRSNKVLNFEGLFFAKRNEDGQISDQEEIEVRCLIFPGEYIAFTEDPALILSQYDTPNPQGVAYTNLPSYADDEGDVVLFRGGFGVIDEFYYSDEYEHALLDDPNGVSLERIDFEESTQLASNWHSAAASVGFATPAYQNSQYSELTSTGSGAELFFEDDETFSPDSDGYEDFLLINYNLSEPGYLATVQIFDSKGRAVKKLADNELLASSGSLKWDGDTDNGEKARIGLYVIYAELFHPNGDVSRFKKPCVVAGKL